MNSSKTSWFDEGDRGFGGVRFTGVLPSFLPLRFCDCGGWVVEEGVAYEWSSASVPLAALLAAVSVSRGVVASSLKTGE